MAKNDKSANRRMEALLHLRSPNLVEEFVSLLGDADPYLANAAIEILGTPANSPLLLGTARAKPSVAMRIGLLVALRRTGDAKARQAVPEFLADPDPGVRRAAIQWAAEVKQAELAAAVHDAGLRPPVTRELLEAWAKAEEMLAGSKSKSEDASPAIADLLENPKTPPAVKAIALRMLPADHPKLTAGLLAELLRSDDAVKREVVRTLVVRADAPSQALLRRIALDESVPIPLRALAVTGLGHSLESPETKSVWQKLRDHPQLRRRYSAEQKRTADEWRKALATQAGDPSAGERVFFSPTGPGCYKCHQIDNRGASVGPDLTFIGKATGRDKLIESILDPSKEVAPAYTAWRITTRDGKERVGLITGETFDSFVQVVDSRGQVEKIRRTDIEDRAALPKSIMPDELPNLMTRQEFLDLIAFLLERK
ncbi:MAG: hypothetical protein ACJ8F7_08340, partial [Gemmataceae bacterium]